MNFAQEQDRGARRTGRFGRRQDGAQIAAAIGHVAGEDPDAVVSPRQPAGDRFRQSQGRCRRPADQHRHARARRRLQVHSEFEFVPRFHK